MEWKLARPTIYKKKSWDSIIPDESYFKELYRISENQIICGANYFCDNLSISRGWVVWDKQGDGVSTVNNELIYTSFHKAVKTFSRCHGLDKGFMNKEGVTIHPTQKPVALYLWLLTNYAKPGDTILDTHGGSFSSAIACWKMGFDLDICEMDEEYFEAACERFERETRQGSMF